MNIKIKKQFLKFLNVILITNVFFYLLSSLTAYISPTHFFLFTFLALGFPLLLISMFFWIIFFFFYERKRLFLLLFFVLLGYKNILSTVGFNFKSNTSKLKSDIAFRVLSWNVEAFLYQVKKYDSANGGLRKMMSFIGDSKADVVCIQDFEQIYKSEYFQFVDYIRDSLKYPYTYLSADIDTVSIWGHCKYGTCIFSKHPIISTGRVQYSGKSFTESLAYADIAIQNQQIRFFNTHLRSMYLNINNKSTKSDFKYVIEDTNIVFHSNKLEKLKHFDTAHCSQASIIKKVMDTTKIPFVFCADLNAVPSSYAYHKISKNLNDAFVQKGFGWGGTYSSKIPFLRIDVVLMNRQLTTNAYFSPRLELSDHYPVIADISFVK